jgi:hypothetical protein
LVSCNSARKLKRWTSSIASAQTASTISYASSVMRGTLDKQSLRLSSRCLQLLPISSVSRLFNPFSTCQGNHNSKPSLDHRIPAAAACFRCRRMAAGSRCPQVILAQQRLRSIQHFLPANLLINLQTSLDLVNAELLNLNLLNPPRRCAGDIWTTVVPSMRAIVALDEN